jgi:RNA polymerase sigma-70 factor (ECF subfamily)
LIVSPADVSCIRAIANGDRDALADLYDRYASTMLAVGIRILRDRREAEDVVHDVFLEAWRRAGDYQSSRGTVRTWLLIRMRSRALDRRKSARVSRSAPLEAAGPRISHDDPSLAADGSRVRDALASLPPDQRTVIELGYFEGLTSSEIAMRVDVPVGTVKSRVAAAIGKLRAGLRPSGGSST